MKVIDLRSDTVTLPSKKMRAAMARAEVGDDVYGEDPTVNKLQEVAAGLVGKEAALFVPSGTAGKEQRHDHGEEKRSRKILNFLLSHAGFRFRVENNYILCL